MSWINIHKIISALENSICNKIYSFRVVNNYTLVVMHDSNEEICVYNVNRIIYNFIN